MFIVCDYLFFITHLYLSNIPLAAGHNNCFSLQFVFYACLLLLDQEMMHPQVFQSIMGLRGTPTTCHNQHGTSWSYSFGQI
jgi:hypothetical protein